MNQKPFQFFWKGFCKYKNMIGFNVRIYGLLLNEQAQQILVSEEFICGRKIIKFPGGGLEFGEGIADCLKREWKEELNQEIQIDQHFYTNDFYQKSAWDESQVISMYYFVSLKNKVDFPIDNGTEFFYFLPIADLDKKMGLPIDIIVAQKLMKTFITEVEK